MKYDFSNSTYAKFWDSRDAQNTLTIFLNDPDIIKRKQFFWKNNFVVDPFLSERQNDGTALFKTAVRERTVSNMLDMRAPLAETQPRDKGGINFYTGSIPDFAAKGYVETAMEREARERMFESYFGNDAQILLAYRDDIQAMYDEAHHTLSNLSAQLLSTGYMTYNYGTGIHGNIYKCPIPAENFKTAGTVAWSDASCKLLDQMAKIEQDYRDATGSELPLKWQVSRDTFFNVILKNAQVIEYITSWRTVNDKPVVNGWAINQEMFNEAFVGNPLISPIEIVEEAQRDGSNGPVHGWADGIAVLRPAGPAGVIKRADLLDKVMNQKYSSTVVNRVFSQVEQLFTFVNSTYNNGLYKEWHTDLFMSAIPTLDEYLDHMIVDTTTADS